MWGLPKAVLPPAAAQRNCNSQKLGSGQQVTGHMLDIQFKLYRTMECILP